MGGWFSSFNGTPRSNLARLNSNGSLDTTFQIGTANYQAVYTLSIQTDEKIIVGGSIFFFNGVNTYGIVRLQDTTTSTGGVSNIQSLKKKVNVYPNPAKNYLNLSNQIQLKFHHIEFYNTLGHLVKSVHLQTSSETIDISSLASGLYIYLVKSNKGNIESGKLLVE